VQTPFPQLLVSVRNADEAVEAFRGGADIIDVKEPLNGSLGRASTEAIASIAVAVSGSLMTAGSRRNTDSSTTEPEPSVGTVHPRLSVALGEVTEWLECGSGTVEELRAVIARTCPAFLKLGLSGMLSQGSSTASSRAAWYDIWAQVRALFAGQHEWVAVAYADWQRAQSPPIMEVVEAAVRSNCRIVLIDTFVKDQSHLLDWLSTADLTELRRVTRASGLQLALAGRVTAELFPALLPIEADIIGVRGAVCESGNRTSSINAERVQQLREALILQ
jgi:hypothetical protein